MRRPPARGRGAARLAPIGAFVLGGCAPGAPSSLDPASPAASDIALVWWVMLTLGTVVFVIVAVLLFVAARGQPPERGPRALVGAGDGFIAWWGVALPAVILFSLMVLHVWSGDRTYAPDPGEPELTVEVVGHMFWWEVRYPESGVVTANEIHIPVGEPVHLVLESADVIHSFWVPRLHGKIDMIPGETNEFWVQADEPGTYRGICAEYCGIQHARMHYLVIASERSAFDAWLSERQEPPPGAAAGGGEVARGREVFEEANCVACHATRGDGQATQVGPDLTGLADRRTLAAAVLLNTRANLRAWILDPHAFKPGVRMPATPLEAGDLEALLDYLETLE